jgi:glycosyltransferase involved in cell wall biosynthesis
MRILFLIPELERDDPRNRLAGFLHRNRRVYRFPPFRPLFLRLVVHPGLYVDVAFGGTLNIMRHCALVRSMGVEAALVTPSGHDTYGRANIVTVPILPWRDIRDDDVCLVPDFASELVDDLRGPVIVYLQAPYLLRNNFDYRDDRVILWTDSPFMLEKCRQVFPDKEIPIVPNIVDPETFAFRPQSEREPGLLFAFPRKGADYIEETRAHYERLGGRYWRFELIDGLPLFELARQMQRPQAFLASALVEGCALPPQESMAAGIVVVGRSARGANFAMEHRRTAMVAETPADAAESLRELEDPTLRDELSRNGHAFISRYFPDGEPRALWEATLRQLAQSGKTGLSARSPSTHS